MKKRVTGLLLLLSAVALGQGQPGSQGFGHVVLPVKSLAVSMAFYGNGLRLAPVAVPGNLASLQAWFEVGNGQQIRLVEGTGNVPAGRLGGVQVGWLVGSLRQTEQQLRQRGLTPIRQTGAGGKPTLTLTDPDGYGLEIGEGTAERPGLLQKAARSIWESMKQVD